jgi:UDP:flavonoid glycosyltransferase YjiC (YdhE family)
VTGFLAYIEPVAGRLYPLVDTFTELVRRGHRVVVRSGPDQVEVLRRLGIPAEGLADPVRTFEPLDWQARSRFGALSRAWASSANEPSTRWPICRRRSRPSTPMS